MDIVKKNLWAIIYGLIVLIALIVLIWPVADYRTDLEDNLASRKAAYNNLVSLQNRTRSMPTLEPGAKDTVPLKQFPSNAIIEAGKSATNAVAQESKNIYEKALEINQAGHNLLVDGALPSPRGPTQIAFRDRYLREFDEHLVSQIMQGMFLPTAADIKQKSDELWNTKYEPKLSLLPGDSNSQQRIKADFDEEAKQLPMRLAKEHAARAKVYVDPGAFEMVKEIQPATGQVPEPRYIWWAQVGYWVQQDISEAIARSNANATNVMDAPIKRLVRIEVPSQFVMEKRSDQAFRQPSPYDDFGGYGEPAMQQSQAAGSQEIDVPLPHDNSAGPTGRISNPMYDVVHATLTVDLLAGYVPQFLANLTNGRFHTVLNVDLATVDSAVMASQGYYFGDKPVVEVTIKLEVLFLRGWTVQYMPREIQQVVGLLPPSPGARR